jgi:hypothetical protein
MTQYAIRNQQQRVTDQTGGVCLQCKKPVGPPPDFSVEATDEHGALGLLHRVGPCKEEWEKAHPKS